MRIVDNVVKESPDSECTKDIWSIYANQIQCVVTQVFLFRFDLFKDHGNKNDCQLEVIIRKPLERIVITCESLNDSSDSDQLKQRTVNIILWLRRPHQYRCDNDDNHDYDLVCQESCTAVFIDFRVIHFSHQTDQPITE